jgi:hypothetical protein
LVLLGISYGCSKERLYENVYEGLKKRDEIKRHLNEQSPSDEPMSYQEYSNEKERIKE